MPEINEEICELEFNPKIYGLLNLEKALSNLIEQSFSKVEENKEQEEEYTVKIYDTSATSPFN